MANTFIYGPIGSGKSYTVVANFILPALDAGRKVFTNLDLSMSSDPRGMEWFSAFRFSRYLKKDCRELLVSTGFEKLKEIMILNDTEGLSLRVPMGSVIVIDEVQMVFNYLTVNKIDPRIYNFLSYARHGGYDLVFTSQNPELVNKFIPGLCNQFIELKGLKQTSKLFKNKFALYYTDRLFSPVILNQRLLTYKPEIFSLYRSSFLLQEDIFSQYLPKGWLKPTVFLLLFLGFLFHAFFSHRTGYFHF